jgi:hypothetical protein
VTPVDIEDRLRSAVNLFVDSVPPANPERPRPDRTTNRAAPAHAFRLQPRKALVVGLSVVVVVIAVVVVVLSHHQNGPSPLTPAAATTSTSAGTGGTGVTATYPPIPRSVAGSHGCLELPRTGMTMPQQQVVIAAVQKLAGAGEKLQELGPCTGGPVVVGLAPGQEALAHTLWARYGAQVSITVGLTAYNGSPGRSPRCGTLEPSPPLPAGLHLALRLKARTVVPGGDLSGKVVVSDSGPNRFFMDTGQPLEAVVVRTGTRQVVGVYGGGIAGTGYGPRLAPGQSSTIPVVGGTARCDGGIGSALPPGRYQVLVRVAPETAPHAPSYLTPQVALRVVGR